MFLVVIVLDFANVTHVVELCQQALASSRPLNQVVFRVPDGVLVNQRPFNLIDLHILRLNQVFELHQVVAEKRDQLKQHRQSLVESLFTRREVKFVLLKVFLVQVRQIGNPRKRPTHEDIVFVEFVAHSVGEDTK